MSCSGCNQANTLNGMNQKLGRCRFCIISSFLLSVALWTFFVYSIMNYPHEFFVWIILGISILMSCLFITHIVFFFLRKINPSSQGD